MKGSSVSYVRVSQTAGTFGASIASLMLGIFSVLGSIITSMPFIIVALLFAGVMYPWVRFHDRAGEGVEHFMRTRAYPAYVNTVRPIMNILRRIFNPNICWFNAINWWMRGIIQDVLFPMVLDCGIKELFVALGDFLFAVFDQYLVNYLLAFEWFEGVNPNPQPFDFTANATAPGYDKSLCDYWITFWNAWVNLYSCACYDMSHLLSDLPILPIPVGPLWLTMVFSAQWSDRQMWCAVGNALNAVTTFTNVILMLVLDFLRWIFGGSSFADIRRPNFYKTFDLLCKAVECLVRSYENSLQRFWNDFVPSEGFDVFSQPIPITMDFHEYLCIVDSWVCAVLKTVNIVLTIFFNFDYILAYPVNPFWEVAVKPLIVESINLIAAPTQWSMVIAPPMKPDLPTSNPPHPTCILTTTGTAPPHTSFVMTNYFLDTTVPFMTSGAPNPLFGKKRMTECLCLNVNRTLTFGANFFGIAEIVPNINLCCAITAVGQVAADITTMLVQITFHIAHLNGLIVALDVEPFSIAIKDGLVQVVYCALEIVTLLMFNTSRTGNVLIGAAIRNLVTALADYVFSTVQWAGHMLIGLLSLPYYYFLMPELDNFVTRWHYSLNQFVKIQEKVVEATPKSLRNSLAIILNNGFPLAPFPCATCHTSNFIPLTSTAKRYETLDVWQIGADVLGWQGPSPVSPIRVYENGDINPVSLVQRIWINVNSMSSGNAPFIRLSDVGEMIDEGKIKMENRWLKKLGEPKEELWPTNHSITKRLILGPTLPPVTSCTMPIPACFDLACTFVATLDVGSHILSMLARIINDGIQGNNDVIEACVLTNAATGAAEGSNVNATSYSYFKTETPINLKTDLIKLVILAFRPLICLCRFLDIFVPIIPGVGRADLCCSVQHFSELIACALMIIINSILSLANDSNQTYFRDGTFKHDMGGFFDVALGVIDCLCNIVRAVSPFTYFPGTFEFDLCCLPAAILNTATEILRFSVYTIISLITIGVNKESYCYFRIEGPDCDLPTVNTGCIVDPLTGLCPRTLDNLGIVRQFDIILFALLPQRSNNACMQNCKIDGINVDQGSGGATPCFCQLLNTLIPFRLRSDQPMQCNITTTPMSAYAGTPAEGSTGGNCPFVDFCCPITRLGYTVLDAVTFGTRMTASLWQVWGGFVPQFFTNYVFCQEPYIINPDGSKTVVCSNCTISMQETPAKCTCGINPFTNLPNTVDGNYPCCGTFTCGKIQSVINDITGPEGFALCGCELVQFLDILIRYLFWFAHNHWHDCFCRPVYGFMPASTSIINKVLTQVIGAQGFLRLFPESCYWKDHYTFGNTANLTLPSQCLNAVIDNSINSMNTWIFRFLGPVANAICHTSQSSACLFNSMFFLPDQCYIANEIVNQNDQSITLIGNNGQEAPGPGQLFFGGLARWPAEMLFRTVGFFEGFITILLNPTPQCTGPNCDSNAGFGGGGTDGCGAAGSPNDINSAINKNAFQRIFVSFMSMPIDSLIGDHLISCSTICPVTSIAQPVTSPRACNCYQNSPLTQGFNSTGGSVWTPVAVPPFGMPPQLTLLSGNIIPTYGCQYSSWAVNGSGRLNRLNRPGFTLTSIVPMCISPDDTFGDLDTMKYPYSCGAWNGGICRPDSLPTCGADPAGNPTYSLDGILMGFFRYFGCAIGELSPVLYSLVHILVIIISIIWQILGRIIQFIAVLILFFFFLVTGAYAPCGCLIARLPTGGCFLGICTPAFVCLIMTVWHVIQAFLSIFTGAIWIPSPATPDNTAPLPPYTYRRMVGERESFDSFAKRTYYEADRKTAFQFALESLYDYDTNDCITDPVACTCRNLNMTGICTWSNETGTIITSKTRTHMTADDTMHDMCHKFTGNTTCDYIINNCAHDHWETLDFQKKSLWLDCIDKRIQGERLSSGGQNPLVSPDTFYNSHAPLNIYMSILHFNPNVTGGEPPEHIEGRRRMMESMLFGRSSPTTGEPWFSYKFQSKRIPASARKRWVESKFNERFMERLKERERTVGEQLVQNKIMDSGSMLLPMVIKADQMYFKYQEGYYEHLWTEFVRNYEAGTLNVPNGEDVRVALLESAVDLHQTIRDQPYGEILRLSTVAGSDVAELARRFLRSSAREPSKPVEPLPPTPRQALFWSMSADFPIVRWWRGEQVIVGEEVHLAPQPSFMDHIRNIIAFHRTNLTERDTNFWNLDLKVASTLETVVQAKTQVGRPSFVWSAHQEENWLRLKHFGNRVYDHVYPGSLSMEEKERYTFLANCYIVDRTVALTAKVFSYCAKVTQLNIIQPNNMTRREPTLLSDYVDRLALHQHDPYFRAHNMARYTVDRPTDPHAYARYRLRDIPPPPKSARQSILDKVPAEVYKRAMHALRAAANPHTNNGPGPAGFNLIEYIGDSVSDFLSISFSMRADTWLQQIEDWFANPNTSEADYQVGDVGFAYWLIFSVQCRFPEHMDCSSGIGFANAILYVSLGFLVFAAIGYYISPIAFIVSLVPLMILWVFLVLAIGVHFSPACAVMFPSLTGISFGIPMCLADRIIAFTDKYITNCYSPLVIPLYMISGEPCPANPDQYIDIINCKLVGVSDGLQHWLFLGYKIFGRTFADLVVAGTSVGIGWLLPSASTYMKTTMTGFANAGATQTSRQWFCFVETSPAMIVPVGIMGVGFVTIAILALGLLWVIVSGYNLLLSTPIADGFPGNDGEDGDSDGETESYGPQTMTPANLSRWIQRQSRDL